MTAKCELCEQPGVDSLEFETGNNAEYAVSVLLCEAHLKEAEDIGYDFEEKYAEQILECLYEHWRGLAD
jgi:hypothetical protein